MINKFKMVPVELTQEMRTAYAGASIAPIGPISKSGYEAMLAAAPASPQPAQPVTMDGKTTIREYVAGYLPEDQVADDWTKGYEECKRRIHAMFEQPINSSNADAGEVERLMIESARYQTALQIRDKEFVTLRTQLAERDALLRQAAGIGGLTPNWHEAVDKILSTAAKPEADHE